MNSLLKNAALFEKAKASGRFASGVVVTCHILNEASMQGIDPSETSEDQTTENKVGLESLGFTFKPLTLLVDSQYSQHVGNTAYFWTRNSRLGV